MYTMKKKYRDITVDGVQYAWMIQRFFTLVIFKNKKVIKEMEVKTAITPKFVEETIRNL